MDNLSDLKKSLPSRAKKTYVKASDEDMREQRRIRSQKLDRDIANSKPPSSEWVRGRNNSPPPKKNTEKSHCNNEGASSSSQSLPQQSRQQVDIQKYIDAENPHYPFLKGAGVVGWRFNGKRLQFLMSRKNGKLDCFGGKVEYEIDVDSAATAAREFVEEVSSGIFRTSYS
jgi:hypothetical protein